MRALLQRVSRASVRVDEELVGSIGSGLVIFVGISLEDTQADVDYLVEKLVNLRIFSDPDGRFNLSALDTGAELLAVSQFTLYAATRKGRRPSFIGAAGPEDARAIFEAFVSRLSATGLPVATGRFQAYMLVEIHNDGPVTIMLDSAERGVTRPGNPRTSG